MGGRGSGKRKKKKDMLSLKKRAGWIRWRDMGRPLETSGAASVKAWRRESAGGNFRWPEMETVGADGAYWLKNLDLLWATVM